MINQSKFLTINDKNLANTYLNIANVLLVVKRYMKSHMDNVKKKEKELLQSETLTKH